MFLRGNALEWYRNNKEVWPTWKAFTDSFTEFFVPRRIKVKLEDDVTACYQNPGELIKDYILRIQSLMRFIPGMKDSEKLERIYSNCGKQYKMYIKRTEFETLKEFTALAETFEYISEEQPNNATQNRQANNNRHNQSSSNYRRDNYRRETHHENTSAVTTEENRINNHTSAIPEARRVNPFRQPQTVQSNVYANNHDRQPSREARRNNNERDEDRPTYQCFNCGELGHTSRYCRHRRMPWCSRCKQRGVTTDQCQFQRNQNIQQCANVEPCSTVNGSLQDEAQENGRQGPSQPRVEDVATIGWDSRPHLIVSILGQNFEALLDTGSTASYIGLRVAEWIEQLGDFQSPVQTSIRLADGTVKWRACKS